MLLFARLIRVIARSAERLMPGRAGVSYRPEKHYMRGVGPKSKHADNSTPRAT